MLLECQHPRIQEVDCLKLKVELLNKKVYNLIRTRSEERYDKF